LILDRQPLINVFFSNFNF